MRVKLDLRPREVIVSERKKVDFLRLSALALVCLFLFMAGVSSVYGFILSRRLQGEKRELAAFVEVLQKRSTALNKELAELKSRVEAYKTALALAKDELPSLEFVSAVEKALLDEVWLSKLEIRPGEAAVSGYAMSEGEVVEFARGLLEDPLLLNVSLPVTRRVDRGGEELVEFNFGCSIKPLSLLKVRWGSDEPKK